MNSTAQEIRPNRSIRLEDTIRILLQREIINVKTAKYAREALNEDDDRHPFIRLAELGLRDEQNPAGSLSTESITRIVANACNLPYTRIDPLKIDVEAVTSLVSQAYATRF